MLLTNYKFLILIQNSHKYGFPTAQGTLKLPWGPQCGMGDEGVGGAFGSLSPTSAMSTTSDPLLFI